MIPSNLWYNACKPCVYRSSNPKSKRAKAMKYKTSKIILMIFFMPAFLIGCRQEIVRVRIQSVGEFEKAFVHDGSLVSLWTDLDIEYTDSTTLWYEIEFIKDGNKVAETTCNLFDTSDRLMERKVVVRGLTKESFLAPMNCESDLPAGEIAIHVNFLASGGDVRIFRADLILNERVEP